jgi:hypothetical protein
MFPIQSSTLNRTKAKCQWAKLQCPKPHCTKGYCADGWLRSVDTNCALTSDHRTMGIVYPIVEQNFSITRYPVSLSFLTNDTILALTLQTFLLAVIFQRQWRHGILITTLMVTRHKEMINFDFIISAGYFNFIVDMQGLFATTNT